MKRRSLYMIWMLLMGICGAALRVWNLTAAWDATGLPSPGHLSTLIMALFCVLALVSFLIFAFRSPCRRGEREVLRYSSGMAVCAALAGALILVGTALEFLGDARPRSAWVALVMLLFSVISGVCMILTALLRHTGKGRAAAELIPPIFLLIKLICNFKNWSLDPIILDYFVLLFGLIFILLAQYGSVGFFFSLGKPRRTLFFATAACFFSLMAAAEGLVSGTLSEILTYGGFFLWNLPVISRLLLPMSDPE